MTPDGRQVQRNILRELREVIVVGKLVVTREVHPSLQAPHGYVQNIQRTIPE